mgnify:CR=1 FL=1
MKKYVGTWHIYEMELWDEDYFNMEVQAFIEIEEDGLGYFQFGLVSGQIDGRIFKLADLERFEFTWEGNDECDHACGSGWIQIKKPKELIGGIKIHLGDFSTFKAKRAK